MKRSSRKQFRTLFAFVAVLVLLTMSLTGCFGNSSNEESTPPETTPPQTSEPASTDTPSEPSEPAPTDPPAASVMGTTNADKLNVRQAADSSSPSVQQLALGTRLEILEFKVVQGEAADGSQDITWGRIADGWVNMRYVTLDDASQLPAADPDDSTATPTTPPADDTKDNNSSDNSSSNTTSTSGKTGTITAGELNIRKDADKNSSKLGSYKKGDKVTILETKGNWGKTDKGWISLTYVKLDSTTGTSTDSQTETGTVTDVVSDKNTTVLGYGVVNIGSLNVRTGPGTKYAKVTYVTEGQRLPYYQKSGSWVRLEKGWVSCSSEYFNIENGGVSAGSKGTITASELNIRKDASKTSDKVGTYKKGDAVEILEVKGNWGKTDKGWISLTYVKLGTSSTTTSTTVTAGTKGTITASALNIRKEASKTSDKVGSYKQGDSVEILEVKDNWGRTDKGWISLTYFKAN